MAITNSNYLLQFKCIGKHFYYTPIDKIFMSLKIAVYKNLLNVYQIMMFNYVNLYIKHSLQTKIIRFREVDECSLNMFRQTLMEKSSLNLYSLSIISSIFYNNLMFTFWIVFSWGTCLSKRKNCTVWTTKGYNYPVYTNEDFI